MACLGMMCDVMVLDQAKVNRLCILLLHRLHASKVSKSRVSSFVPCTSPSLKPSLPHSFLFYMLTLKRGVEKEEGNTSVFQIGAHLFTEFCCHSCVQHHRLLISSVYA